MTGRHILILNRASGGNEREAPAEDITPQVERTFRDAGVELETVLVDPSEMEAALHDAVSKKPVAVIVGGGDGSVAAAAGILGGTGIALGILPMGTFNLAARDLEIPLEIPAAAEFLAQAGAETIDVLDVSGHACLCTTILGFYPEFSHLFEQRDHGGRWWRKTARIIGRFKKAFLSSRPLRLTWEADSGGGAAKTKFASFVPGRYQKSAGLIPLREQLDSGKLTGYIGTQQTAARALRAILGYAVGKHEEDPNVTVVSTTRISIRERRRNSCRAMIDGEILRLSFPIEMRILQRHLLVLKNPTSVG